jgi:hypothetical protein
MHDSRFAGKHIACTLEVSVLFQLYGFRWDDVAFVINWLPIPHTVALVAEGGTVDPIE